MSMSKPTQKAPAAPAKNPKMDKEEEEEKTMEDLPPEVLTVILEHVILSQHRNEMLVYRLVNSQWMDIVDSILEKEVVSGRLHIFPAVKIGGGQSDQLYVHSPKTVFSTGSNPLTFNSLLLKGSKHFSGVADTVMTMPIFMSKFGSNLTVFALQDQIIGTKSLAAMLRSMSNLKVLCLNVVWLTTRSIEPGILLPPPLPSLTKLDLTSEAYHQAEDGKDEKNPLYVWLIASYADQLVHLILDIGQALPALQKRNEHSFRLPSGKKISIATTSDSAFVKLKELEVYCPSQKFLRFTQTPSLQHLSITGLDEVDLRDLKKLIGTCGSTLRDVFFQAICETLEGGEPIQNGPSAGVVARNVKTLTLTCTDYGEEQAHFDKTLLSTFPALEVIQLLYYEPCVDVPSYDGQNQASSGANESSAADEIISLKQRSASLRETAFGNDDADYEEYVEARKERKRIFERLAKLGLNVNQVIFEQGLEQRGVWNTCPDLKTVCVSSGGKPVGDVCVIQRMMPGTSTGNTI